MTDRHEGKKRRGMFIRHLARGAALAILVVSGLYLLLTVIISTPAATSRISQLLSSMLQQPATVEEVNLAGGTVIIHGLTIANPAGFSGEPLLAVRSITVTPVWWDILAGRKSFAYVRIQGLRAALMKNSAGTWNFSGLTRLTEGKKAPTETFIRRLVLERSAVMVNGRGIDDISLTVNDLSTKGTTSSSLNLSLRDDHGTAYHLAGSLRLGKPPVLDLSLSAPSLSFKVLKGFGLPLATEKGTGKLLLRARLHEEELKLDGKAGFERLTLKLKGEEMPLRGTLAFAGRYDLKSDTATLDRCSLEADGVIRLRAGGRIERVRKERVFTAEVSHDGAELKKLSVLLPPKLRRDLLAGGTLLPGTFRVAGTGASGITAGSARISLRHGELLKGERLLCAEVAADADLVRVAAGWEVRGKVFQGKKQDGLPLQLLDVPFTATFSDRLSTLRGDVPAFAARVTGVPVTGKAGYRADAPAPVTVRLDVPQTPLAVLSRSFSGKKVPLPKGSATASISAAGRGPGDFRGDVTLRFIGLQGRYGGKELVLAEAAARMALSGSNGKLAAVGALKADGGLVDGKPLAFSCACRVADGLFTLSDGVGALERTVFRFKEISGAVPRRHSPGGESKLPLTVRFEGVRCLRDGTGVDGLAGKFNAFLVSGAGERWLEGDGSFTVASLAHGTGDVGSLSARFVLAKGKMAADATGRLLDGRITASASGDPFAVQRGVAFAANLAGMTGSRLSEVLGKSYPAQVAGGVLAAAATGTFDPHGGLRCRMTVAGNDIALAGRDGGRLLSGGELKLDAEWADGSLFVREGRVTIGKGPVIVMGGKLVRAASADREGEITLALAKVSLAALLDSSANLLPRPLREATAAGEMTAEGKVRVKGKEVTVEGEAVLTEGALEVPAQKLSIAAINGAIPFSLAFPGSTAAKLPERLSFTRENYPKLLPILRQTRRNGRAFSIGKVRFGTMELGPTRLAIRAEKGVTEIFSLESEFYHGALLGRGFFRYKAGVQYGADILIYDVSLRELCNSSPAIKGYLSGRLDGVVSLYAGGRTLNDVTGFVEIWTLGGKGEKMLVSKEFLQKLAGKKFKGIFFRKDRPYDRGEINAYLENGYLTFDTLDISHTNFLGIRDLSVSVAAAQNTIGLDQLFTAIKEAAARGKAAEGGAVPAVGPVETEFKWEE